MQTGIFTQFIANLTQHQFEGDIETTHGQRLIAATDNSIYQLFPTAVLHPKNHQDVEIVMRLLGEDRFRSISLTARGGGTGTNGQSLTTGIVLDLSRYMNRILDFNETTQTVTVQTGVVKDQLNAYLRPLGYFFAPELSTSNRATIGGMINTDASGQGSCAYGKTSQHVKAIKSVFLGGKTVESTATQPDQFMALEDSPYKNLITQLRDLIAPKKFAIDQRFPKLNRFITGYDLWHFSQDEHLNLNHILCGSEGTLGVFTEAKLNVLPIPKHTALVMISYNDFIKALEDAPYLMMANPTSIEVIDNIVMDIAKNDFIWATTEHYFDGVDYTQLKAIQLIEFNADTKEGLEADIKRFIAHCEQKPNSNRLSIHPLLGKQAVTDIYGLRKRAVGLLGAVKGNRRPIPFVEDTAVPPENLAAFISEFKAILDQHQVKYGMFGHADAGVIHVRPALDLKLAEDRPQIREISDKIFALCQKYGGALWGEHGKGVRSEYSKEFFGDLYPLIQQVKRLFDPHNQLNPNKIATPNDEIALLKIDEIPLRADFNREIKPDFWQKYNTTLDCNGNGACFNYDLNAAMCPSYKATRKRINSPKGRSELIKEWLRLRSTNTVDNAFEKEVYDSLSLCLSCKSCTGECPVKVNIPDAKAEFMHEYHKKHKRPFYEVLLAKSESLAPLAYRWRKLYRPLTNNALAKTITKKIGLEDLPSPQDNHLKKLESQGLFTQLSTGNFHLLEKVKNPQNAVIIIPDAFFAYYDPATLHATIELLSKLKVTTFIAPYTSSGKIAHVLGKMEQFKEEAKIQNKLLTKLSAYQIPLVGIEPPITLLYQDEYKTKLKLSPPHVALFQEWLLQYLGEHDLNVALNTEAILTYQLLSHCTEKTNATSSPKAWVSIFTKLNAKLSITSTGCCGMSGSFGHVAKTKELSHVIYQQSWEPIIEGNQTDSLLATGFSCRSQVERFSGKTIVHPIVKLNELIQ